MEKSVEYLRGVFGGSSELLWDLIFMFLNVILRPLNPYGNVRSYSDLGPQSIIRPQKCQPPGEKNQEIRTKKILRPSQISYIRCWQTQRLPLYYTSKPHTSRDMVSYLQAQKQKVRITLELNVFQDFNARDIDFERLFDLEPGESVESYIEEFDRTWHWEGSICPCKVSLRSYRSIDT